MAGGNRAREEAYKRAAACGRIEKCGSDAGEAFGATENVAAKAKRFSRGRMIVALLAVFAVLSCAYVAIPLVFSDEETDEQESLLGISQEDIVGVSWQYNGQTTEVEFVDGSWSIPESEAEIDQDSVESIAQTASSAVVERRISADSQTDGMGLDAPAIQANLTLSDGSTVSFSVGSTDDAGDTVYVKTSLSDDIVMASAGLLSAFSTDVTHLYVMEEVPNASQVDRLSVSYGGKSLTLAYHEGGSDASYSSDYEWFIEEDGSTRAADEDAAAVVTEVVNGLTWESCIDPACDDASSYGLDDPDLVATMEYTTQASVQTGETDEDGDPVYETQEEQGSFTLEVGDMAEDGTYYARPQGSTAVYTIDSGDVQTLIDAVQEGDYFATDDVCLMDWDTVDSIEISYGGQTETLEFVRESVDGDDVDESTDTSYRIGGEDADAAAVESMLDAVTGMSAEGEATGSPEEEGFELSLTFRRNTDTFSEMTLGFTKYNNSFYLVSFNEEERLLVNRNDVAELEEMIEAL